MRLGGIGSTEKEGYVEARGTNGVWGGICDDGFRLEEANVICKMAGYPRGAEQPYVGSHFGNGNGPFLLDELNCEYIISMNIELFKKQSNVLI